MAACVSTGGRAWPQPGHDPPPPLFLSFLCPCRSWSTASPSATISSGSGDTCASHSQGTAPRAASSLRPRRAAGPGAAALAAAGWRDWGRRGERSPGCVPGGAADRLATLSERAWQPCVRGLLPLRCQLHRRLGRHPRQVGVGTPAGPVLFRWLPFSLDVLLPWLFHLLCEDGSLQARERLSATRGRWFTVRSLLESSGRSDRYSRIGVCCWFVLYTGQGTHGAVAGAASSQNMCGAMYRGGRASVFGCMQQQHDRGGGHAEVGGVMPENMKPRIGAGLHGGSHRVAVLGVPVTEWQP